MVSEGRLRVTIGGRAIEATLADSDAARDFASLLPLTLAMNDLFRREKFAALPRAISEQGKRTRDYAVGTIGYWPPRPDVAILSAGWRKYSRFGPHRPRQDQGRDRSLR